MKRATATLEAAVCLLAVGIVMTGCASEPPPATQTNSSGLDLEGIDLDAFSRLTAQLDYEKGTVVLPVDAIRTDSSVVIELRSQARQALVDSCLRESGLPGIAWPAPPEADGDRLYGLWSVSLASRYGFELPSIAGSAGKPNRTDDESRCIQTAREEMAVLGQQADGFSLDKQISAGAYDAVQVSAEGKAAIAAAQACMTTEGLVISPDSGQPALDDSAGNSETNIRIAIIEATCRSSTGSIQTLYDLTARYQAALIDRNEAAVVALAQDKSELIAGYQEIIDANK